jgi:hypothetical protein
LTLEAHKIHQELIAEMWETSQLEKEETRKLGYFDDSKNRRAVPQKKILFFCGKKYTPFSVCVNEFLQRLAMLKPF